MKAKFRQLKQWFKKRIKSITPGDNAVKGASYAMLLVTALLWIISSVSTFLDLRDAWIFLLFIALTLAIVLGGFLNRWLFNLLCKIPRLYLLALFIAAPLLFFSVFDWVVMLLVIVLASLTGAGIMSLKNTGFKQLTLVKKIISIIGVVVGTAGFIAGIIAFTVEGFEVEDVAEMVQSDSSFIDQIVAASPAEKGPYKVKTLTYGSGTDIRRKEYGDQVDITTDSVNGIAFIDNWDGFGGWWRTFYWGFDARSLPINARVWYPEGDGPFPLALIVHGNHSMQDYSDPGYDYLGELLASRGIILASVDENFINGSWSDIFGGLEKENDARGWLLLEHLKVWHEWNEQKGHAFYQKIDTSKLALMGHSRGGEAVAHAAMFNQLDYYPDDASVTFDYHYDIQSIVAIAPVDGQFKPKVGLTSFENVSYLVLHGAQDADVSSFMGAQQFERIEFTDSLYHFKSGVYVYGANHGQFNTSWGNTDSGPYAGLLNLKQLLSKEDQEKIAEVFISSFLEVTLKGQNQYLPVFLDARAGKKWLPETLYLNQFEDATFEAIADFEEDYDVSSVKEGNVETRNLSVWREQEVKLKWQDKGSRAAVLGWNYDEVIESDTIEDVMGLIPDSLVASYEIRLSESLLDSNSVLVFSMAESKESSNPKTKGKWVIEDESNNNESEEIEDDENEKDESEEEKPEKEKKKKQPLDLTIELTDSAGVAIRFPLSSYAPLQREIIVMIRKVGFLLDDKESEKVYQTFYFPIADLKSLNPDFNSNQIEMVKFVFDRRKSGVVVLDHMGTMEELK